MIYFTADTHFTHMNISGTQGRWDKGHRGFESLDQHDDYMLNMLNQAEETDTIYLLGDFVFNRKKPEQVSEWLGQIRCDDIHLILGNHDPYFQTLYDEGPWWDAFNELGSPFDKISDITPHKEIKVNSQRIVLNHYGLETWNKLHHGAWMLHGHSHDTLPARGKRLDVCPEAALRLLGEMRMFTFKDLQRIMSVRELCFVDHHNKNTNQ